MAQGKVYPSLQAVILFWPLALTSAFHHDFITSLAFCFALSPEQKFPRFHPTNGYYYYMTVLYNI